MKQKPVSKLAAADTAAEEGTKMRLSEREISPDNQLYTKVVPYGLYRLKTGRACGHPGRLERYATPSMFCNFH